jgi:iron complex outermembrane receptor protein
MKNIHPVGALATAIAFAALPATTCAQTGETASSGSLEEIIVTARKRAENIQDTPIAVTALSSEALEARLVTTVSEIGRFTPNMSFENTSNIGGSTASTTVFIRGIGQTDFNLTIDPGVGLYVDGVYVSRSVGSLLETVDLERVEVLRGPQGTLFGKNTIGGAVVMTSRRPEREFSAWVDATTGSDSRADLRGSLNVPLGERLALRVNASTQNRDGYVDRLLDGGTMGDRDSTSGRMQLQFEATDALTINLSADATRTREEAAPVTLLEANPVGGFASFWNFALNGASCFTPPNGLPIPNAPQCFSNQWLTGNPYKTWANGPNDSDLDLWGTALTVDWDLGSMALKSVTSYRDLDSFFTLDTDGAPQPISQTQNEYSQRQWSQEFQLSGTGFDERLKWLTGLYYLKEEGTDRNNLVFSIADFLSGGKVDNDSYAAFGQVTFDATDRVSITLGGRYTDETKRFLPDQYIRDDRTGGSLLVLSRCFISASPVLPPNPACVADPILNPDGNRILPYIESSTKATEFTPSLTVDYKLTDSSMVYASYSKGFKSGGFTQRVFPPEPAVSPFTPEFVKSYEIGLKTELFDQRLRWNSAVFYTDYSDLQIIVNEGIAPKVRNAGKAEIQGFESEFEWAATDVLRLNGSVGYTDAKYNEVPANAAPVTEDSKLPNAPKWTASLGAQADIWTGDLGTLTLRADWSYKDSHYKDAVNSPQLRQDAYSLLSASLALAMHNGWTVSAGGTNLTDEEYLLSGYQDLANASAATGAYARPSEWFLKVRKEFGAQ